MDIKKFLSKFNEHIRYAEIDNGYAVAFPFKFYNDDHISSIFISEDETGLFTVTDNGNTLLYLENNGVDLQEYAEQINKICRMFNLTIEDGLVKSILGEYETNQTFTHLSNFFTGISLIATVKRLNE